MAGAKPLGRHRARSEEEKGTLPCAPAPPPASYQLRAGGRPGREAAGSGASLQVPWRRRVCVAAAPWPAGRPGRVAAAGTGGGGAGARPRLRTQASDRRWTERPGPARHQPGALGSPDPALHHLPL